MNKRDLLKQFSFIPKGCMDYELNHVRKEYKTERGFMNHLTKVNEANEKLLGMADISEMVIDVEWKRSAYWGNCPRAEWRCWFKDGSFMEGSEYASGCGYDKLSQVMSFAFNKVAKGMAWRKRNSRKAAPYGLCHVGKGADKNYLPRFEGGIGASCYRSIAEYLGGKMDWNEGKTWDRFVFTFK